MQKFLATGQLYMNTLEFFRNMEEGFQGDPKEGKLIDKSSHATLEISSKSDFSDPDVVIQDVELLENGYVYCFFAAGENDIKVSEGKLYYNQETPENLKEAVLRYRKENESKDTHIIILDAQKTIQAIEQQLKTIDFAGYQGFVEYVHEEFLPSKRTFEIISKRPWGIAFIKSRKYSYQKEWRLFIHAKPSDNHAEIYLGDMKNLVVGYAHIPPSEL